VILAGKRTGARLREAYRAMDIFAFASLSETQGMVIAEAMAAGLPVVALNATGVREVVLDRKNGFMLPANATTEQFAQVLDRLAKSKRLRRNLGRGACATAARFSREECARRMIALYEETLRATRRERLLHEVTPWSILVERVALEWDLLATRTRAVAVAVFGETTSKTGSG
jgi:glycosyltransferase involved in cell wall biosynthesis